MPGDIRSLNDLAPHARVGATFKTSRDGGTTWEYVKVTHAAVERFSDGSRGYPAHAEVKPGGGHGCAELTDRDFSRGVIVRVATAQEVQGKKWSYEQ